jgi:hypothetical protein
MSPVIEVRQLHKRYWDTVAVDDISFAVEEGEMREDNSAEPSRARRIFGRWRLV